MVYCWEASNFMVSKWLERIHHFETHRIDTWIFGYLYLRKKYGYLREFRARPQVFRGAHISLFARNILHHNWEYPQFSSTKWQPIKFPLN